MKFNFRIILLWLIASRLDLALHKRSNGDIDLDVMINELENHLKRHYWKAA